METPAKGPVQRSGERFRRLVVREGDLARIHELSSPTRSLKVGVEKGRVDARIGKLLF